MKALLFLLFMLPTLSSANSRVDVCRFDLVGPKTLPDSILEVEPLTAAECKKRAQEVLQKNADHYDKALIKNSLTGKWTVVTLDEKSP